MVNFQADISICLNNISDSPNVPSHFKVLNAGLHKIPYSHLIILPTYKDHIKVTFKYKNRPLCLDRCKPTKGTEL